MKKIVILLIVILFALNIFLAFSLNEISENHLYFSDTNNNNKIDKIEIEFNNTITWTLNTDKLFLYSNTWWLSTNKLDNISGNSIFSSYSLSWNTLIINLVEQDNSFTGLIINNTTTSHLRLKTNAWVGISDLSGNEIKLLYTSSFSNYSNLSFKSSIINNNIPNDIINDNTNEPTLNPEIVDENINSWTILDSSWNINTWSTNTLTWNTNTWLIQESNTSTWTSNNSSQIISTGTFIPNFQTKLLFQSPTYFLESDSDSNIFNCDSSKTDCKVNFNLNIDFWSWFVSIPSNYECLFNFWFSGVSLEENKCNPNTITYPIWEYELIYKIQEKSNHLNYIEKKIKIINWWYKEQITTKTVYISSSNTSSAQNSNISNINIETPKIIIQSGLDDSYKCIKEDCSINFNYETKNAKELCLWDFWNWDYEQDSKYKCNPWYVKYKLWDFKIKLKVYESWNESNYKENYLSFTNKLQNITELAKKEIINKNEVPEEKIEKKSNKIIETKSFSWILEFNRVLANNSWVDNNEWIEVKNISNEKFNFNWCEIKNSNKKYSIKDDLFIESNWIYRFYKEETKLSIKNSWGWNLELYCNWNKYDSISWAFDTPEDFIISRDILSAESVEEDEEENAFILNFADWSVKEILKETEDVSPKLLSSTSNLDKELTSSIAVKSIIEVQWKLWENKKMEWNKIICLETDECSVNFDWRSSKWWKDIIYLWDFWNGKTFDKPNPAAYKFVESKNIVSLKIFSDWKTDISYFSVELVSKTPKKEKIETNNKVKEEIKEDFVDNIKEEQVLENKDTNKFIYIAVLVILSFWLLFFVLKKRSLL